MKIDKFELEKQRREEILKSGEYAKSEIVIGKGSYEPISSFEVHREIGVKEIACILLSLKNAYENLAKRYPEAKIYGELFLKGVNLGIIKPGDKLIDIKEDESEAKSEN